MKAQKTVVVNTDVAPKIKPLPRLKGEAGDRKRGFVLIEAMGLNKSQKNQTLYNSILVRHSRHVTSLSSLTYHRTPFEETSLALTWMSPLTSVIKMPRNLVTSFAW